MKTLVVYYTRTKTTKKVGDKLAEELKCDSEEIIDTKKRAGAMGWLSGGKDAGQKNLTKIEKIKHNPSDYDLVIIGTPVWAWTMTPAIRTYLTENKGRFKKLAFFCTMGGDDPSKTFPEMEELSKKPVATVAIKGKKVWKGNFKTDVDEFLKKITK